VVRRVPRVVAAIEVCRRASGSGEDAECVHFASALPAHASEELSSGPRRMTRVGLAWITDD
jgi:hypothetical protein